VLLALPLPLGLQVVDLLAARQRIPIMLDRQIPGGHSPVDLFLLGLELVEEHDLVRFGLDGVVVEGLAELLDVQTRALG
jgi:hypothetical protein